MNNKLKILAFTGSLRNQSYNKLLLKAASELAPESMEIEMFDLKDIPLYNSDVEAIEIPESVIKFKEKIKSADGLLIGVQEYNYSISGVLKNAIDWASRPPMGSPLNQKPATILGGSTGMSGTIRAQAHLRQVLAFSEIYDMKKPEVLVTKIQDKFDNNGNLIDEKLKEHLLKFLNSFEKWINIFKN
jgi:chromate reductase